jgi:hypothetical protein
MMQNTVLNDLQVYRTKYFDGLVDQNLISQALLSEPHQVSTMLSYIFGTYDDQSPLNFLTGGLGRTMTIESQQYQWKLMVEADKPVTINNATWQGAAITSNMTPGINGTPIQIWVTEKFFGPGAVVEFDNKIYQARIMGEPYQDGNQWVYTVQVADGQAESYIPPSVLTAGSQLSRAYSAYEEYSDEADIVNYQTPVTLRNHLTTLRLKYDITGDAHSSVMVIEMRDPKTKKKTRYWSDYQEWMALRQWYRTIDYGLMYSKYNADAQGQVKLKGTNGRPIYIGAGLLQQISPSNRRPYTKLTTELLEDFLYDLVYNIKGMGERKFVALSGEMGMKGLDRVLREKASGYTLVDTHFVTGSGQDLTLGGQFTTYKMLNGVVLSLKHFPLYDNLYHNRLKHPVTGKPVESYRMTFIQDGMVDGEPNVVKVVRKDREFVMWHNAGSVAPGSGHGKSISTLRSNGRDGYTVFFLGEMGIMMKNPTAAGELILDVE